MASLVAVAYDDGASANEVMRAPNEPSVEQAMSLKDAVVGARVGAATGDESEAQPQQAPSPPAA